MNKNNEVVKIKKEKIILIHSAWLGAWQWQSVKKVLTDSGYEVITPDLPGHGDYRKSPSEVRMIDYVNTILGVLDKQDRPVILLGHSFNGITVSRVAELRPEKVSKLVFLAAFLLPSGMSFFDAVNGVKGSVAVENFYLSEDKSCALVKEEMIRKAFAQDVPEADFDKVKAFIVPEPATPLAYILELTDSCFGKVPKYYIECTFDNAVPIEAQRSMYQGKVRKVYTMVSSHTPNFSQPEKLAEIILEIARD